MRKRTIAITTLGAFLALSSILTGIGVWRFDALQYPEKSYARNFEQVAYHDLGGHAGFKMAMQHSGDRWYLYVAGLWGAGWMILDVTDPHRPVMVRIVPQPESTQAVQIQASHGLLLTGLEKPSTELLQTAPWETFAWIAWRTASGRPLATPWRTGSEGLRIWDISNPINPRALSSWETGASGTHRNFYNGGRYAYLTATRQGYRGHILVVLDLLDPLHPVEVSHWALPEQRMNSGILPVREGYYLHGPAHIEGNRAYLPYGIGGAIILDITNPRKPHQVGRLELPANLGSTQGVHTFLPIPRRRLAIINSESHAERCEHDPGRTYTAMVDISDEQKPRTLSFFPEPIPPKQAPYMSFCDRNGRAGPHNQHHSNGESFLFKSERLVYIASFSAGLRLYDTIDPLHVREIGYFLPRDPRHRLGPLPSRLVTQTEDVIVDARGYAYITDKNQGIYIVKATSPEARAELAKQTLIAKEIK